MADVNVTQTYRINIETNKDAKSAIDNIKALREELKGVDSTLDKLRTDPISKLSKALDTLSKIDVGKISGNIKKLKDLNFSGLKKMTDTMKGLDASPLQRLTSALKGFSKISADAVNSSINSVRNIDFSPLNEVSDSLENIDSSPLSKLLNVLNRVGKIDLNNLGVINDNLAKVGNVNVSGLSKLNEQIKELDVTKLYMLSATMVNFARSGKKGFDEVNKRIETSRKHISALNILGSRFVSVIDAIKAKLKSLSETKIGGNIFKNLTNFFSGTLKGLQTNLMFTWRFIKYRIMNAITRAISMAFTEGVKAVYEWASITGNEFVGVMDRITTSTFYAKNALGALGANILTVLEPVIISLCDWLVKAVDLVSMFVAKITGQDYYLSVATKTFKSYGDAINGVNKALGTLAGFDEINNIGSSSSSAGGSTTGVDEGTFKKVNLEDAFKGKTWLESLALTIRDVFFDWSELNGEQIAEKAVTGLFGLIGLALGGLKGAILGVGLSLLLNSVIFDHDGKLSADEIFKSFLAIITPIIGAILGWTILPGSSVAAGIGIAIGLFYALKFMGFKEGLDKTAEEAAKGNFHKPEHILVTEQGVGEVLKYFDELKANIGIKTQEIFDNIGLWLQNTGFTISTNFNGIKDSAIDIWDIFSTNFGLMLEEDKLTVSDAWTNIKNSIVNNLSEAKTNASLKAVEIFNSVTKVWANLKKFSSDTWGNIKLNWNNMWSNLNTNFRTQGNKILSNFESWINFFIDGFNNLTRGIRSLGNDVLEFLDIDFRFNDIRRISLPRLATGTNYVPQDTLAMLHQGEAVVPKKFNSEEFFGGDSEETNELLRELISVVRKKNFSITKKEVGEASVDYIRSQTRLKGASVI